ncbi:MAG TPA: hypothetical protein ENJ77_00740 [Candidatus Moranbacteria bacterium]|nr:hypothetical protein [Candidatus Moranbacteria bacterium]
METEIITPGRVTGRVKSKAEELMRRRYAAKLRRDRAAYRRHKERMRKAKAAASEDTRRDILFLPAFALAIFKDLIDLTFVGALPGLGTIISFTVSLGIIFILLVHGVGSKHRRARRLMQRSAVVAAAGVAEGLFFGFNFLPVETTAVFLTWRMVKRDRKKDRQRNNR